MAELALGVAGIAVAGIPGMGLTALAGFQIGVTLGSLLFPPSGPHLDRGRIDEMRIQGAGQGSPIPIVYGRNRVAGTIIWATGLKETKKTSSAGGKGGGGGATTTDYSYKTSLAVVICEGTLTKVRRIWANEKVIYDWRSGGSPTYAAWLDTTKVRVYLGTQVVADAAIEADKGVGFVPAHKGLAYVVFEDMPLSEVGNQIPNFTFEVESSHANLQTALDDVASRCGLTGDVDFSAVSSYPTRGLVVSARTEASRVMETFAKANWFEIVETGGQIKAVVRTGVTAMTIPSTDVGASSDGEVVPYVESTRAEETELPREIAVSYQSEAIDFLTWTQTARRTVRWSENQEQVAFPMSLGDAWARYLADSFLMETWASRSRHSFTLPYKYLQLDPGDVITIPDEGGSTRDVRIVEMSMGLLAQIEVRAVDDNPIIYVDPVLPASVPTGGGAGISATTNADLLAFEVNAVYDDLADSPQIGLVAGRAAAGWHGGEAQVDPRLTAFGSGPVVKLATFTSSSDFGYTTNDAFGILGHVGTTALPYKLDTVNTVRVTMTSGTPASVTYDQMIQEGRNLCIVGKEILQFQTATLVSGTTYTLSNLLRFRRGTDYLLTLLSLGLWDSVANEGFIIVNTQAKNFAYEPSQIGATSSFRMIETGKDYSAGLPAFNEPLVLAGNARKPYGPCDIRYSGDRSSGNADLVFNWTRRVRKKGELDNYVDAPLDEIVVVYNVEIWKNDLTVKYATYQVTSVLPWTYTIAQQTTDTVNASSFYVIIRQVSAEAGIGEGHPSALKLVLTSNDIDY
jgi:hypothetical protein